MALLLCATARELVKPRCSRPDHPQQFPLRIPLSSLTVPPTRPSYGYSAAWAAALAAVTVPGSE